MFKINIYLKLALIVVCLVGGILLSIFNGFWYGFPFIFIGVLLLASYLLLGTIISASEMIQKQDFEGAKKRLAMTVFPNLLISSNKPMYYIVKGSLAMNDKDNKTAEELFEKAKNMKLSTDDEKAMVLLQLANVNALRGKWTAAKNYFRDIKKLSVKQRQIKDQILYFEQALQSRNQNKNAQRMGKRSGHIMNPGGKRRRPKSR